MVIEMSNGIGGSARMITQKEPVVIIIRLSAVEVTASM